jgi:hypothetical protein
VPGEWLKSLKEEESKHNTASALREGQSLHRIGPAENPKTPINPPSKTSKTPEADQLGLVATWSHEFGYVSMHDPTAGEAHKRKQLYKDGNRKAYRLTSREMEKIWEAEHLASEDEGIVEDHPLEED